MKAYVICSTSLSLDVFYFFPITENTVLWICTLIQIAVSLKINDMILLLFPLL